MALFMEMLLGGNGIIPIAFLRGSQERKGEKEDRGEGGKNGRMGDGKGLTGREDVP
jgi:hypothetical protein